MSNRILAVDDSRTMRHMVASALKTAGFEVLEAEDGKAALDVLNAQRVDLIITDLHMPNLNGLQLIENVRTSQSQHKHVPILLLTTETDTTKKEQARNSGATGWMAKPFSPEKLIQVVNKVIQVHPHG